MNHVAAILGIAALLGPGAARADVDAETRKLAHDLFKQLIEINTTDSTGSVTAASEAMAQRLRAAGFPESDIHVVGPNERKKNLVVRLHGTGKRKPVLLIGHLDVVEARREDWTTNPFQFVETDGYYYGRGTQDMKDGDAILLTTLIRFKKEGYRPDRDIILALTADEESGSSNGVAWLLKNHRDLVDAEFALDNDGPGVLMENGKTLYVEIDASEKVYADFQLTVTSPGGHSSIPVPDNAIYHLTGGLDRLSRYEFPFELSNVTRGYYERQAILETGSRAADMRAILKVPPDPAAIARLASDPLDHAVTHTTCVTTTLEAGHANNALPQTARAIVNCRILPGHSAEEVRKALVGVLADPRITVRYVTDGGQVLDTAESKHGFTPAPLREDVMRALEQVAASMWPGAPVIPMLAVGASDAVHVSAAGIPVYQVSGEAVDRDDLRAHGQDERIRVESFYRGIEFHYAFLKALMAQH
jgi:acetylornithine deacetylase/succinyl-diaminopimelate desuccinylase-like protein